MKKRKYQKETRNLTRTRKEQRTEKLGRGRREETRKDIG